MTVQAKWSFRLPPCRAYETSHYVVSARQLTGRSETLAETGREFLLMGLQFTMNDKPLGHVVEGIDLRNVSSEDFARLDEAYQKYGVIVVRGQDLTPEEQINFSRRLGNLVVYPMEDYLLDRYPEIFVVSNIIENGRPIGMKEAGADWHTDMSFTEKPPRGSILYAVEVPHREDGTPLGDTLFSSLSAAYDALPQDIKARIEGKMAVFSLAHTAARTLEHRGDDPEIRAKVERQRERFPDVVHPIVREHPLTKCKTLYISPNQTCRILDMEQEESDEILSFLNQHVLRDEFVYRHVWKVGDVVMWDNCIAIHKAVQDYKLPLRRKMLRTTLEGWPTQ